ncbi:DUF6283 family protein [Mycolicibacterium sphagni]|uniref:Uncharacterized protein n=1 Tax=Mycolicibacterium sphagni TaxID=1786 RepID=A0A255E128_9MYCO|nr:DUF6283 family protein [Mycolicibacterium sphagni]OYN81753.1 hypothetical protein CG716_05255 [Mycolicibacterium sphagni]
MTGSLPHKRYPCNECPWRRDTPPGKFPAERYEALRSTAGEAGHERPLGSPIFACHKTDEGKEQACAGWLATVGIEHIGMRLAVVTNRLPGSVFQPGDDWPELFDTYDEMAETQGV